jgi:hypothetical protein
MSAFENEASRPDERGLVHPEEAVVGVEDQSGDRGQLSRKR